MTAIAHAPRRRRVLIVNCYFDTDREHPRPRTLQAMQSMAPAYLAGAFRRDRCDVRLYSEHFSGPLLDRTLFAWPELLVLTGLTPSFDRMLQITAYVRTLSPGVVVVAGGPAVRAMPRLAGRFFDYACTGDIEQLQDVVREVWGSDYVEPRMLPRYDLVRSSGLVGYIETSRGCNFACSFCSIAAEGRRYTNYDGEYVREQVRALGRQRHVLALDNNFFGNDRRQFLAKVALMRELHASRALPGWSALVTSDFFHDPENVRLVREAGCMGLFSGVESFDEATLRRWGKRQNTIAPQQDLIRSTLEAGVVFTYGLMADVTNRTVVELRRELDLIVDSPEITLPVYITLPIPLVGTDYFRERLRRGELLPRVKLRDLDGSTITMRTADPLPVAARFARDLQTMRGYRRRMLTHTAGFLRRYGRRLSPGQLALALGAVPLLTARTLATAPLTLLPRREPRSGSRPRTHVATTEPLDALYVPAFRVPREFARHFEPTLLTDERGELGRDLVDDVDIRPSRDEFGVRSVAGLAREQEPDPGAIRTEIASS